MNPIGQKSICAILNVLLILAFEHFISNFFHNAIAFNDFLFKIKRKDYPNCCFCDKYPESIFHIFCECDEL